MGIAYGIIIASLMIYALFVINVNMIGAHKYRIVTNGKKFKIQERPKFTLIWVDSAPAISSQKLAELELERIKRERDEERADNKWRPIK